MQAFRRHQGIAAPLLRENIDTDAIIPSREMKTVTKHGLAEGLFAGWRYRGGNGREPAPDFVLNWGAYRGASVLLAGANFGCGSSREHAVWALKEFGFRAILAPSFGAIFAANCVRNGVLAAVVDEATLHTLAAWVEPDPQARQLIIDLEQNRVLTEGLSYPFDIGAAAREALLDGRDPIAAILAFESRIEAWEAADRKRRPWLYDWGA